MDHINKKEFKEFANSVIDFIQEQKDINKLVIEYIQQQDDFNKTVIESIGNLSNKVDGISTRLDLLIKAITTK